MPQAMPEEIGNPLAVLHIRFAAGKRFDMLRVDQEERATVFKHIVDGMPEHASPNVTKGMLDWEYTREILQSDLRARTGDQLQAPPHSPRSFHEGSIPQGPGASHVQHTSSAQQTPGGHGHV